MDHPSVVGIGASAGGVEALFGLLAGLTSDLDATLLVVVHQASGPSVLAGLLARRSDSLTVTTAHDGDRLRPGRMLLAPPDVHLTLDRGRVVLDHGARERGQRPSVDRLFRSLAREAGPRATGVVLSGLLNDGAAGLAEIARSGGAAVVQDPDEALFDAMPRAALARVPDALVRHTAGIGPTLRGLHGGRRAVPDGVPPTPADSDESVDEALVVALRVLDERIAVACHVAALAEAAGATRVAAHSRRSAHAAMQSVTILRRLLASRPAGVRARAGGGDGVDGDEGRG